MNLIGRDKKDLHWGESQEASCVKITILSTAGKTPILRHYHHIGMALLKTDASDFAIGGILYEILKYGDICPVGLLCWKLSSAKLKYNIFDKEMLAIVYSSKK